MLATRLRLAEAIAEKYPSQAKRQLREAEALSAESRMPLFRTRGVFRPVGASGRIDFEEAERLAHQIHRP